MTPTSSGFKAGSAISETFRGMAAIFRRLSPGTARPIARARQGRNGVEDIGYDGPQRSDAELPLAPGAGREQLERAVRGHGLAECELSGTYERL
jgi:hypothetical protein